MKWSLGNRAMVKKNHPWNGKIVTISGIISGSVVRITDDNDNSTIISLNYLMKPQYRRETEW